MDVLIYCRVKLLQVFLGRLLLFNIIWTYTSFMKYKNEYFLPICHDLEKIRNEIKQKFFAILNFFKFVFILMVSYHNTILLTAKLQFK